MLNKLSCITLLLSVICLLSFEANAVFRVHPKLNDAFIDSGSGFLDDAGLYPNISSSVSGQIAAGVADSIADDSPVSEEFLNLIVSPSDSSLQSDGEFHNGAAASTDGDELALSGTAGTSTNYLSGDGSADFSLLKALGSNSIIEDWARSDQAGAWMAIAFRYDDIGATAKLFGNRFGGTGTGVGMEVNSTDTLRFFIRGDSGQVFGNSSSPLVDATEYVIFITWDGTSGTNNLKFYVNSDTPTDTFSLSLNSSTSASTNLLSMLARNDGIQFAGVDTRLYGVAWGDAFSGDAGAAEVRDWFQLNTPIP